MAPPDGGGSGGASPRSPALRRQMSYPCSGSTRDDPPPAKLERRLSCSSAAFSSPAASLVPSPASSTSTTYHPATSASNKASSCESIPFTDPELPLPPLSSPASSSSSTIMSMSSCESFFHVDSGFDCSRYLDVEPPAVQAMTAAGAFDSKRLPSSMFRTRSTNPAEWSVTSNESLFSIRLHDSADVYYYDAAGFPRFASMGASSSSSGGTSIRLTSVSEVATGGLCLKGDCTRCSGAGSATRKSVRFAITTETVVSGGSTNSSTGCPATANTQEPTAASKPETPGTEAVWCQYGCCWPFLPATWWPRCCAWHCQCCDSRC